MESLGREGVSQPRILDREEVMEETSFSTIAFVHHVLDQAKSEVGSRATTYDKPDGEESMPQVISLFNTLYGTTLTPEQGWMFMVLLKAVRSASGAYKKDNYVDLAAYAAFACKAAADKL